MDGTVGQPHHFPTAYDHLLGHGVARLTEEDGKELLVEIAALRAQILAYRNCFAALTAALKLLEKAKP